MACQGGKRLIWAQGLHVNGSFFGFKLRKYVLYSRIAFLDHATYKAFKAENSSTFLSIFVLWITCQPLLGRLCILLCFFHPLVFCEDYKSQSQNSKKIAGKASDPLMYLLSSLRPMILFVTGFKRCADDRRRRRYFNRTRQRHRLGNPQHRWLSRLNSCLQCVKRATTVSTETRRRLGETMSFVDLEGDRLC